MQDRHWKYYPALKLVLPFACGIALARAAFPSPEQEALLLAAGLAWLVLAMGHWRAAMPYGLMVLVTACGMLLYSTRSNRELDVFAGASFDEVAVSGRVMEEPVMRRGHVEYIIDVDSMLYRNSSVHPATRALVQLRDRSPFDPAALPILGDHIVITGQVQIPGESRNPSDFDARAYYAGRGIGMLVQSWHASSLYVARHEAPGPIAAAVQEIRRSTAAFAADCVGGEEGDIVQAIVTGDRSAIDPETAQDYSRAGAVHILSVSGFHVGVLSLALFVLVSWFPSRRLQLVAFLLLIGCYTIIAGGDAPIVRSSVMAGAFLLARVAGRIARPLNTLGFAALVILVLRPGDLFDLGFQLSFASVAGTMLLYGRAWRTLAERVPVLKRSVPLRAVVQLLLLSATAQIFTLPLLLYHFGSVSIVGLLVNIPIVPLYSVALAASFAGALVYPVAGPLAAAFGGTAYLAIALANTIVHAVAALSGAVLTASKPGIVAAAALAAAMLFFALSRGAAQTLVRGAVAAMTLLLVTITSAAIDPLRGDEPRLLLLAARTGLVAVELDAAGITCYQRGAPMDSGALASQLRPLIARRQGAVVRAVNIDSIAVDEAIAADGSSAAGPALLLNDHPREVGLLHLPVILSSTSRAVLAPVRIGTDTLLRVGLGAELERALVLAYDGRWRVVEW